MAGQNWWNLESFLDSLVLELDKAQDTLSLKGLTRKLTYTVKDVALDLQIFPDYQEGKVRFATARPGEQGASKLSIQLGSITDRQIRETANEPIGKDEVAIEMVEDIDREVKESLQKVGVTSTRDLERLEERNVDIGKVVSEKTGKPAETTYKNLAQLIKKARRRKLSPSLSRVMGREEQGQMAITLSGSNLVVEPSEDFPVAALNDQWVDVAAASEHELQITVPRERLRKGANELKVALDPYAVMSVEINAT